MGLGMNAEDNTMIQDFAAGLEARAAEIEKTLRNS